MVFERLLGKLLPRWAAILAGVLAVWSCTRLTGAEVVIAATADLHGCAQQFQQRIAPLIGQLHRQHGDSFIYVDVGDTVQGTLAIQQKRGAGMLPLLYAAGCQLWVPGNHELEFGFNAFRNLLQEFHGTTLAANLHSMTLRELVQPYVLRELGGYKIAFIGLMLRDMNNCFPIPAGHFQTLGGQPVLRRTVKAAREAGADAIVLLRHVGKYGGKENLNTLLKNTPEVDLVIGAHSHIADGGSKVGNSWYVQPPAHGSGVVKAVLVFDDKNRRLTQIETGIIPLEQLPEPESEQDKAILKAWPLQGLNMPALCMKKFTGSDLALYAVSSADKLQRLLQNKQKSRADCFKVFPYFDPVITVRLSGREVMHIVREYTAFAHKRQQFIATAGFRIMTAGSRLQDIVFDQERKEYTLAISAYAAAGAGGQLPGIRRILSGRIDFDQAENAPGILDVILKVQEENL